MAKQLTFTCIEVKATKTREEANRYTDQKKTRDCWIATIECNEINGHKIGLYYETEIEARRFDEGKTYTVQELAQIILK